MLITANKYIDACRRLEGEGFTRTDETWAHIDEKKFEVARALHPDGSHALYKRPRNCDS